jgi:hypothetical protein
MFRFAHLRAAVAALSVVAVLGSATGAAPAGAQDAPKKPITSASDLPRYTYPIAGTASGLIGADAATFAPFAAKVRADIDALLATYDIQDRGTLRGLLSEKLDVQVMSGTEDAAAAQTAAQIRALEDKPDSKLLSGVITNAVLGARADTAASSGDAFATAFQKRYAAAIAPLPWSVVGTNLKESKTSFDVLTPALMIGQIAATLDPAVEKTHELSGDAAGGIIRTRFFLTVLLPLKAQASSVIGTLIAKNTIVKRDIWAARDVTLKASDKLTPVRLAVWDSGSDVTLFPGRVFTDPHPAQYDPHGLAFDLMNDKTHGYLLPRTPEQIAQYASNVTFLEGFSDLQDGIDSAAATSVKKQMTTMAQADVASFFENLEFASIFSHGTHVAGIAMRGNPAARLVVARITFDYKSIPTPPAEALERKAAANDQTYVNYFRAHHVRVVNMSWGGSPADYESSLEKNGIGSDANERKAMAAKLFAIDRTALYNAIKSAPDVLFVCSAGNSNGDSTFNETIPAAFDLPNLLVVGAVDQAGDETSFTSYGKTVKVDGNGYHVESYVPGGMRVKLSGTSMSSPNVANLAAKLVAVDPKLTPVQTIALIEAGATATPDGRRHNIDERASIAMLRKRLAKH